MIDRFFSHYEVSSPLAEWNPAIKMLAVLLVSVMVTLVFDPLTPLVLLLVSIAVAMGFGRVPLRSLLSGLVPAVALAAGLVWTNVLFARPAGDVWWQWGPLHLGKASLLTGLSLGLRVLVFASYSLLFLATTDPSRFVLSLILDLKVPYRFGYAMLAVYRFLPMLASEFLLIRGAQRIRGVGEGRGIVGWFERVFRYTIPLLATGIRRAERVAIAMEARGLGPGIRRTYYQRPPLRSIDIVAGVGLVGLNGLILLIFWHFGLLRMWHGQLF